MPVYTSRRGVRLVLCLVMLIAMTSIAGSAYATPPTQEFPSLQIDYTSVTQAGPENINFLFVSYEGLSVSDDNQLSLHPVGARHETWINKMPVPQASGTLLVPAPLAPGWHEFRLYSNGIHVATSAQFEVLPNPASMFTHYPLLVALVSPETSLAPGQGFLFLWVCLDYTANDWVSVHPVGADHSSALSQQSLHEPTQSGFLTAPSMPGTYELRLFRNGIHVATSNSFVVG